MAETPKNGAGRLFSQLKSNLDESSLYVSWKIHIFKCPKLHCFFNVDIFKCAKKVTESLFDHTPK